MKEPITNSTRATVTSLTVRGLGALLLVLVGADHYYEYSVDHYSVVPTIGTLFLLNFISATIVGLVLLAPLRRIFQRLHPLVLQVAAISGFGIALTSLVALLVSEQTKLFGFMESNYRPAIVIAIAFEASAALFLALLAAINWTAARSAVNALESPGYGPPPARRPT
ncbi:MAG: hypothetical protein JO147_14945 [Actinobacteria bacterium]|nr:hypothetical protein [Actinomycetota bacterium]